MGGELLISERLLNMSKINVDELLEIFKKNELIQSDFFEIEKTILRIHTFNDLINILLKELKLRFNLMHAGIMFINDNLCMSGLSLRKFIDEIDKPCSINLFDKIPKIISDNPIPILANTDLNNWKCFFPKRVVLESGSIAIIPLWYDNLVIGTLNMADIKKDRFNSGQSTFFLERLATIISICVDNVLKHEQLKKLSMSDPLTGLANRRLVHRVIEEELVKVNRYGDSLSVLYIDLDDFKTINDSYGHDVGDLYLKHVSSILRKECRDFDCVGRLGGDEFLIVLCRSQKTDAVAIQTRINKAISAAPFCYKELKLPVCASTGLASTNRAHFDSTETLIKRADDELYISKKERKYSAVN